jgi:hypothetical protein
MMMFWVFLYGISLTLLGLGFYLGTGQESPTALIPAVLGGLVLGLGALCSINRFRVHGMHAVTALAVLGILGGAPGVVAILGFLAGGELTRPYAAVSQTLLAVFSLGFFLVSLRSFVMARRARELP